MNKLLKRLMLLPLVIIIFLIIMTVSGIVQSWNFPELMRLSPGQTMTLSVHYPIRFVALQTGKDSEILQTRSLFTNSLILNSKNNRKFQVQLKIFGKFPIKQFQVEVAYPILVIPGGQAIGVLLSSRGVVVVGHLPLTGIDRKQYYPAKDSGLKAGDILLAIDKYPVNRVEEVDIIMRNLVNTETKLLKLTVRRQGSIKNLVIKPVLTKNNHEERFMLGIYIEDPAAGVGTLTFYDPLTLKFGGLGHQISDIGGKNGIKLQQGEIVFANISGIRAGKPGQPGEKVGLFNSEQELIGKIQKNTRFGIYGSLYRNIHSGYFTNPIPIAYSTQIKTGPAEIYTVLNGNKIEKFKVHIIKVFQQRHPKDKGMIIKITDPKLLKETGGIVQGMSGSPIVQNGLLIGAVTHVFVNDPTKGYGVLAEWMIKEISTDQELIPKAS